MVGATGIDIHKAGASNYTGTLGDGTKGVSQCCLLIDINNWSDFIGIFNNSSQKSKTASISVSRSMATPVNVNRLPVFNFIINGSRSIFFNNRMK